MAGPAAHCPVFTHCPASPTMPTGTAPERLTFCTLGPAPTIVVSCKIGSTVDISHSRGSTAVTTSLMSSLPPSAASMSAWMAWSQIPVRFDGACTNAPDSCARDGGVDVVAVGVVAGAGLGETDGADGDGGH